jgi:hypothetical protein
MKLDDEIVELKSGTPCAPGQRYPGTADAAIRALVSPPIALSVDEAGGATTSSRPL